LQGAARAAHEGVAAEADLRVLAARAGPRGLVDQRLRVGGVLDPAITVAAVARDRVAVVAGLAGLHLAVAALRGAGQGADLGLVDGGEFVTGALARVHGAVLRLIHRLNFRNGIDSGRIPLGILSLEGGPFLDLAEIGALLLEGAVLGGRVRVVHPSLAVRRAVAAAVTGLALLDDAVAADIGEDRRLDFGNGVQRRGRLGKLGPRRDGRRREQA